MKTFFLITLLLLTCTIYGQQSKFVLNYSINGESDSTTAEFNFAFDHTIFFKPTDNLDILNVKFGPDEVTENVRYKLKNGFGEYAEFKKNIHDHLVEGPRIYEILVVYFPDTNYLSASYYAYLNVNITETASITEIENDQFHTYPNPVQDILNIKNDGELVELYSTQGQLILTTDENFIDMTDFKTGIYFLRRKTTWIKVFKN